MVGLDESAETLAEARRRVSEAGIAVEFVHGDVAHLPFADAAFTCCRAERMLQHVEDPRRAVRELARVTRLGGRIVIFDTDWEMLIVDADDVVTTRAISLHVLQPAAESALRLGRITREQCDAWFADILHRHAEGRFFSSATAFILAGHKQ